MSAYLHLLCRISSNLYSRHRQADRRQPAKIRRRERTECCVLPTQMSCFKHYISALSSLYYYCTIPGTKRIKFCRENIQLVYCTSFIQHYNWILVPFFTISGFYQCYLFSLVFFPPSLYIHKPLISCRVERSCPSHFCFLFQ